MPRHNDRILDGRRMGGVASLRTNLKRPDGLVWGSGWRPTGESPDVFRAAFDRNAHVRVSTGRGVVVVVGTVPNPDAQDPARAAGD